MTTGLGIDLVSIARIRKAMEHPRFVQRILTPAERAISTSPEFVAGRWAAKEAFAKAVGEPRAWHSVEVLAAPSGQPILRSTRGETGLVSISHEREMAVAVVLLQDV